MLFFIEILIKSFVLGLCVAGITKAWFNGFYTIRSLAEAMSSMEDDGSLKIKFYKLTGKLLTCPVCLPLHIAWLLLLILYVLPTVVSDTLLLMLSTYSIAVLWFGLLPNKVDQ